MADWLDFWPTDSVLKCHGDEEEERQTGLREEELPAERRASNGEWVGLGWAGRHKTQHNTALHDTRQHNNNWSLGGRRRRSRRGREIVTKERMMNELPREWAHHGDKAHKRERVTRATLLRPPLSQGPGLAWLLARRAESA